MNRFLVGLGVLVALLVAAAFVGPLFVSVDSIKQDIARQVEKATGRNLAIDGKLSFRILPTPGVSASGVRLSNAAEGSAPDMLNLEAASVEIALLPLLSGNILVRRIVVSEPDILLERYADGTNNWTFRPAAGAAPGQPGNGAAGAGGGGLPPVRLDNVVVEGGTLAFRTPDSTERFEAIFASVGADTLRGPFRAEGSFRARGFEIGMNAAVGEFTQDKATPINMKLSAGGAEIGYSGILTGGTDDARLSGQVEMRAEDLSALAGAVAGASASLALQGKALEIEGTLEADETAVSIGDLAVRLGEEAATGAVEITLGEIPDAHVTLDIAHLDLERLFEVPPDADAPATPPESGERADAEKPAADPGGGFAIPSGFSGTLETRIGGLVYRGGAVRQVILNAHIEDGALDVSQATAQLPGGAGVWLAGFVSTQGGDPRFEGRAELSADDFRTLLQWLGVDAGGVPQDRLRKMAGSMSVAVTPESVTLTDMDLSLDVSRLRGGIAIALRERPGFGIGLSLDRIDLDAYLPPPEPAEGDRAGEAAGASGAKAEGSGSAALGLFDAIVRFKVGEAVWRGQRVNGIDIDGTLQDGGFELHTASVENLAGAGISVRGTIRDLAEAPRVDMTVDLDAGDPDRLLALAGIESPMEMRALQATVGVRGDLAAAKLDATIGIDEGRIGVKGRLKDLASGAPTGDLEIDARMPDTAGFVRMFAPDYAPARADLGTFELKTDVALEPDALKLSRLAGNVGPVNFMGGASIATGGDRPRVTADLASGEIVVDWFLPAEAPARSAPGGVRAGAPAAVSGGGRWSREPIDLSGLHALDADIKLSAPAIAYSNIRVDQPRLAVRLEDGVLDLERLSGDVFGGAFSLTARIAARDVPTIRYTMVVDGADAAKFLGDRRGGDRGVMSGLDLLFPVSEVRLASGKMGADLDVTSSGRSEFEMISNLSGKGAMRFTDAVIEGVDLCGISDQLDRLDGLQSFLGLALAGRGGQTRIEDFNGRFDLADGVATLPQQQINTECTDGAFSGTTNLPKWLVDIRTRADFPAHPEFPGIVIEQRGPLDAPDTKLVNAGEINRFAVGKAAGSIIRRLLPGSER